MMKVDVFVALVKKTVADYANAYLENKDGSQVTENDVLIQWIWGNPQHHRAVVGINLNEDVYFMFRCNREKEEVCMDIYKKTESIPVDV